jgi:hypothetical protein
MIAALSAAMIAVAAAQSVLDRSDETSAVPEETLQAIFAIVTKGFSDPASVGFRRLRAINDQRTLWCGEIAAKGPNGRYREVFPLMVDLRDKVVLAPLGDTAKIREGARKFIVGLCRPR